MTTCSVRRLLARPDFRQQPLQAIGRRLYWRLRWALSDLPWLLTLPNGLELEAPRCGGAALIYYQGFSEPTVARFLMDFLKPGMTFVDVGAHLGELSLIAAQAVGLDGWVYAFEPHPTMAEVLTRNVARNGFVHVTVYRSAVGERDGTATLAVFPEPSLSRLAARSGPTPDGAAVVTVPCGRLDTWAASVGRRIDLVKVDVEGAELLVLQGAARLLGRPPAEAPVLIVEWSPANWSRFGGSPAAVSGYLEALGYRTYGYWDGAGLRPAGLADLTAGRGLLDGNVLASKRSLQWS